VPFDSSQSMLEVISTLLASVLQLKIFCWVPVAVIC